jgi:hypothetical protein
VTCAVIQARTAPTFQAVTRSESFDGLGNVPAFTLRQRVGALKGNGAGVDGRLGLCTSCASRMKALSGRASNEGIAAAERWTCNVVIAVIGVCFALGLDDILCPRVNEGFNVIFLNGHE